MLMMASARAQLYRVPEKTTASSDYAPRLNDMLPKLPKVARELPESGRCPNAIQFNQAAIGQQLRVSLSDAIK
jgi:hypothetical protein